MEASGAPSASSIGIVYITFGKRSAAAALKSYESVCRYHDIPAIAIGDYDPGDMMYMEWNHDSPWQDDEPVGQRFYAGRIKPFLYEYSPFDRTLYLDADTEICQPISTGFEVLDIYNLAIADDPRILENTFKNSKPGPAWDWIREQRDFTHDYIGKPSNPQINTGVIFFRKSKITRLFFKEWYKEWLRFPKWDEQMAFMRAEHNLRDKVEILHLVSKWNTNNIDMPDKIIYHMWGLQKARDLYAD